MLDVISQAKNAIEAYNTKLKTISSNVTNIGVVGYKRMDVSFQQVFNRTKNQGKGAYNVDEGGVNPSQTGGTVAVANTAVDFKQGELTSGAKLDLAIQGNGLFIVSPDGGNTFLYSRNGEFQIKDNKLLTKSGMQVYGFKKIGGVASTQLTPIDLSGLSYNAADVSWDIDGTLVTSYDEKQQVYGPDLPFQIALSAFPNPGGLEYRDGTTFSETAAAGAPSLPSVPGSPQVGIVAPRGREKSNIFYTSEIVDSLEIQRALSSSLTAIRLINDSISQFIQKLG